MKTIAVFLPNWVGDVVMATPTLRALREHFAAARILGVMRPQAADVLAGTPWLDEPLLYDPRSADSRLRGWALCRRLRRDRVDLALLLPNSWRTALLARFGGARDRLGYVRGGRGILLNRKLYPPRSGKRLAPVSALDYYLELAYAAGCPSASRQVELATLAADEQAADEVWRKLRLPHGKQVVVLNSGGAYGAAKLWPTTYFASLARRLAVDDRRYVLVLCGPQERAIAAEIVRGAAHPRVCSLAEERLRIGLSKACVRRAAAMVTTDSGPRHFAAAFGVPVVTLFGPTHIGLSENYHPQAIHLQRELECVPCQRRTCPLGHHRCMLDLNINEVYRALKQLLPPRETVKAA
ncbi:MAG TPA: lipopolysaccharide heptosyltransferase II [Pirellulales bacterium]|nr:lipopolysaccharide heptosyltransferase II [Pirellulales bacterium]